MSEIETTCAMGSPTRNQPSLSVVPTTGVSRAAVLPSSVSPTVFVSSPNPFARLPSNPVATPLVVIPCQPFMLRPAVCQATPGTQAAASPLYYLGPVSQPVPSTVLIAQPSAPAVRSDTPASGVQNDSRQEPTISQQNQQAAEQRGKESRYISVDEMTPACSDVGDPSIFDMEDGIPHDIAVSRQDKLTDDECREVLPSGQTIYVCKCRHGGVKRFKYRRHLEQHFLLHRSKNQKSLCHLCGKCFTRADHLNRHAETHKDKTLVCQLCGETNFPRPSHLSRHWQKIHPHLDAPQEKQLSSEGSSSTAGSILAGSSSSRVATGNETWTCKPIGKRRRMNSEDDSVDSIRKLPGDPDSLARYHANGLIAQLASTTTATIPGKADGNGKKFVCTICREGFGREAHLKRHARMHTGLRPYNCFVCHETFARGDYLQQHLVHLHNERPIRCEKCGQHFTCIRDLFAHNKAEHRSFKPSFLQPTQESAIATSAPVSTSNVSEVDSSEDDDYIDVLSA